MSRQEKQFVARFVQGNTTTEKRIDELMETVGTDPKKYVQ